MRSFAKVRDVVFDYHSISETPANYAPGSNSNVFKDLRAIENSRIVAYNRSATNPAVGVHLNS
jgi:adenylate kinase